MATMPSTKATSRAWVPTGSFRWPTCRTFSGSPVLASRDIPDRSEGPNHFADMDQKDDDGEHASQPDDQCGALSIPTDGRRSYDSVNDILSGDPIAPKHRGLLPFRVWQIFR